MHLSHEKNPTFHYTGWLIGILFIAHLDVLGVFVLFFWFPTSKLSVTNHIFQLTSVIIQVALHCARVKFNWNVKGIVSLLRFSSQQHLICCGDKAIVYIGTALPHSRYHSVCLVQTFCWDGSSYADCRNLAQSP